MKLYLKYFCMQLKSMLEYKRTFFIRCFSQIALSIFDAISIIFLFDKFGSLKGYTFDNVLICFSVSYVGFAIAECFARGFEDIDELISNGEFDRLLVRPRNVILQILGTKIEFSKFGRAMAALIVFMCILIYKPELLVLSRITTLILMILGTIIIYFGIFILKAAITFFTIQGLEIMNIFTYGARDLTQYPLDIYKKWVKNFFTYIIPLAVVNYYPLLYVIGRTENKINAVIPGLSILFLIPCYIIWKIGIKRYKSIGS